MTDNNVEDFKIDLDEIEKYLEELVGKYAENKKQESLYKSICTDISNEIDGILHQIKKNLYSVYITALDKMYECKYIDRTTKKIDYMKLAEVLSDAMYDEVVKENVTTYLKIGPAASTKNKTKQKPVKENNRLSNIPSGRIK